MQFKISSIIEVGFYIEKNLYFSLQNKIKNKKSTIQHKL